MLGEQQLWKERKWGKKREEDTNFEPVVQCFAWRWIESCKDNIMASLFHLNNNWGLSHKDTPILKKQKPHDQFPKLKKFQILQKNLQKPLLFLFLLLPKPLPVTWLSRSVVQSTCGDVHTMSKNLATASLQKATAFVHIFYHFLLLQEEEKEELVVRCQLHFTSKKLKTSQKLVQNYKH